jgi:hypothetical protein
MNFKSMLTANIQMKLLSLLLAALLWLFIAFESVNEIEMPFSLKYVNIPAGLSVKADQEAGGLVRLEGPAILLLRQKFKGASTLVDLSGASVGKVMLSGVESSLPLVKGIKVVSLSPVKVELYR